jgi:hypothetical protein
MRLLPVLHPLLGDSALGWCSRIFNHWFIWVLTAMTWLPTFTFIPFFMNTRSSSYLPIFLSLYLSNLLLTIFYNTYYTILFVRFLRKVQKWEDSLPLLVQKNSANSDFLTLLAPEDQFDDDDELDFPASEEEEGEQRMSLAWVRATKIIAWKSIGHSITSTTISVIFIFDILLGTHFGYVWALVKMLGMHLWFNWRLEKILCPMPMTEGSKYLALPLQKIGGVPSSIPQPFSAPIATAAAVESASQIA